VEADRLRNLEEQIFKEAQKISEQYFRKDFDKVNQSMRSVLQSDAHQSMLSDDEALFGEVES